MSAKEQTGTGILVGRQTVSKASYEYVVIPKNRNDIDVLVTTLPVGIMNERLVINTRMLAEFLRGIYIVEYQWMRKPTPTGFIDKGKILAVHGRVDIDIDNPLESLKKIDEESTYNEIHDVVSFDVNFLRGIVMAAAAAATDLPKRSLSIQIASRIKDSGTTIIMNIGEAYSFLCENPELIRGVGILRSYKVPVIVIDEIPLDVLREHIVYNMNNSIQRFYKEYSTSQNLTPGEI